MRSVNIAEPVIFSVDDELILLSSTTNISINYIAGFACFKLLKKIQDRCCKYFWISDNILYNDFELINIHQYNDGFGGLAYPSTFSVKLATFAEGYAININESNFGNLNIDILITKFTINAYNYNLYLNKCINAVSLSKLFLKIYLKTRFNHLIKTYNINSKLERRISRKSNNRLTIN